MRRISRRGAGLLATVALLAAAVAGLIASRGTTAHERPDRPLASSAQAAPAPGALSLTVGERTVGRPIPPGFLGLSLEYTAVERYAGENPDAINPVLVQLIRNLTPGQDPVLRIGGDTTDWTWWPVPGMARPRGIRYTLGETWLRVTAALAHELNARLILGINLEADSTALANFEARTLIGGLGPESVEALELGNEPELYGAFPWYTTHSGVKVPGRPRDYDFSRYTADYSRMSAGLPHAIPLAGPGTGAPQWLPELGPFLAAEARVRIATLHRYPLRRCFAPAASPSHASIANLLAPAASEGLAESVAREVAVAHARDVALRIDELNSVSCGGAPGVSNVFASALWALDAVFSMARVGVDGVNIHTLPRSSYGLFTFARRHGRWTGFVAPDYYGLLMFAQAAPPGSRLLETTGQLGNVRAWATSSADGLAHVVLINDYTTRSRVVAVHIPGARGLAIVERLRAPGIAGRTGVTLGGQTFGSSTATGTLSGRSDLTAIAPVDGTYIVPMPKASAAMLTLTTPPAG